MPIFAAMTTSSQKITIAIDGYSSCGKSTLAKAIAKELNYVYVDTGAMYRGTALYCHRLGLADSKAPQVDRILEELPNIQISFTYNPDTKQGDLILNGENVEKEIRTLEISQLVSPIAAIKEVRTKMVEEQRIMGKSGGVVLDGRDIGSVVFPNAELKLFLTAEPSIRAERRRKELEEKGENVSLEEVLKNIEERDYLDTTRKESPLIQTEDAVVLDNSFLTREEQLVWVLDKIREILV